MVWKKGESGNASNKGNRLRVQINQAFLRDVREQWALWGSGCLEQLAKTNPGKFVDVMVALLPKEAAINVDHRHKHEHALAWVQAIQDMPPIEGVVEREALECQVVEPVQPGMVERDSVDVEKKETVVSSLPTPDHTGRAGELNN